MTKNNKELQTIKNKYGEKFMKICKENFSIILEEEGKLLKILESSFSGNSKDIGNDIEKYELETELKDYIFSIRDNELSIETQTVLSPEELLKQAGYDLKECKTEEDIQSYAHYYKDYEIICTIKSKGRLNKNYVFFAVKDNAEEIERSQNPQREDPYGVSVLSIQFDKYGICMPHIICRYNHTVRNPDATYRNDLDRIIPGLTNSFAKLLKERGIDLYRTQKVDFKIPSYVKASDGKYYKYNMNIGDKCFCPNNIVIANDKIYKIENPEQNQLIDYFILDLKNKKIKIHDCLKDIFDDSFVHFFEENEIEKIDINKSKEEKKYIIKMKNLDEPIEISVDKNNAISKYNNTYLTNIEDNFMLFNKRLNKLELPQIKQIKNNFLTNNYDLKELIFPNIEKVGKNFLDLNSNILNISMPQLQTVDDDFLTFARKIEELNLPKLKYAGINFLKNNKHLKKINLPQLKIVDHNFLKENTELEKLYLPELVEIGRNFLWSNEKIKECILPKINRLEDGFLLMNPNQEEIINSGIKKQSKGVKK